MSANAYNRDPYLVRQWLVREWLLRQWLLRSLVTYATLVHLATRENGTHPASSHE